jgi:hypothetical protein
MREKYLGTICPSKGLLTKIYKEQPKYIKNSAIPALGRLRQEIVSLRST